MENLDSLKIASKLLRSQREKLNLSLEEISTELRLDKSIIRDIEKLNFNNFYSYLFLKGYLKNYADFLGIKINLPDHKENKKYKITEEKNKVSKNKYTKRIIILMLFLFSILIFSFIIDGSNKIILDDSSKIIHTQEDGVLENTDNLEIISPEEKVEQITTPYNQTIEPLSEEIDNKLEVIVDNLKNQKSEINSPIYKEKSLEITHNETLVIDYSGNSWTEIINSNGDIVFFNLVKGGETIQINILAPFEILFGDATVVNIKYNNKIIKVPYFNPDNNVGKIKINY